MGLVDEYCDAVYRETGMRAAYPPNVPVALGDYGTLEEGVFRRLGALSDFGLAVRPKAEGATMSREFKTRRVSKALLGAGAAVREGLVLASPSLELGFDADFSVFVALAGCTHHGVDDLQALGEAIVALYRQGRWDADWAFVSSLVASSNTTVIVARERGSKMVLSASAEVASLDLADASLSLRVVFDSASSEAWVTEKAAPGGQKLTPFFWLHRVKTNLFGGHPRVQTLHSAPRAPAAPSALAGGGATPAVSGEELPVGRVFDARDGWRVG
ncbi:MAG TPA: hypothetical protein VFS00_20485 [Polyangiaceae bacterium]|nr:hypothetical protein [Polyangiaceae bacterium]